MTTSTMHRIAKAAPAGLFKNAYMFVPTWSKAISPACHSIKGQDVIVT